MNLDPKSYTPPTLRQLRDYLNTIPETPLLDKPLYIESGTSNWPVLTLPTPFDSSGHAYANEDNFFSAYIDDCGGL